MASPIVVPMHPARPGPQRKPLGERLWAKVAVAGEDECWPWAGATNGRYGIIARGGHSGGIAPYYVHRVAFALAHGLAPDQLPSSKEIRHSCDTPLCCNPRHLSLGSSRDNKRDAIRKGRMFWQAAERDAAGRFLAKRRKALIR